MGQLRSAATGSIPSCVLTLEGGLPGIEFSSLEVEVRFHGYGGECEHTGPCRRRPLEGGPGGPASVWVSLACDRFLREKLVFRADADTAAEDGPGRRGGA